MFTQDSLQLSIGDTLKVSNDDNVVHSLFARTDEYNIQEIQKPGGESIFSFDKAGTIELRCAIHPKMMLTITVE